MESTPEQRARAAAYMRQYRASHPPTPEQRARAAAQQRARYKPRSPEQIARSLELQAIRRAAEPERQRERERQYRKRHPERIVEINRKGRERLGPEYWAAWQRKRKGAIVERYGGQCACCGELELTFLTVDHVNGGGHQERLRIGPNGVYRKLLEAPDLLPDYRVLCMNCQFGTRNGHVCPHQAA